MQSTLEQLSPMLPLPPQRALKSLSPRSARPPRRPGVHPAFKSRGPLKLVPCQVVFNFHNRGTVLIPIQPLAPVKRTSDGTVWLSIGFRLKVKTSPTRCFEESKHT